MMRRQIHWRCWTTHHHPLVKVAVLAEAHFLLHGWLRSGNCGTSCGVVEFLKEALALLTEKQWIRVVRADAGFFDQQLLGFLEQRGLFYIVVARLTLWLKREAAPHNELNEAIREAQQVHSHLFSVILLASALEVPASGTPQKSLA